jgi:hypothetical protein
VRKVRSACLEAEKLYRPEVHGGRVILFRSNHRALGQVGDPRAGWQDYVSRGLEIQEVTGNHENILLEPQVQQVAKSLKNCLYIAPPSPEVQRKNTALPNLQKGHSGKDEIGTAPNSSRTGIPSSGCRGA